MHVDYLIIGQGISGTWLSYYLQKEGISFLVIDDNAPHSSSRIAAGIINPVTGRRHVTVWMADEILPFAATAYKEIGFELDIAAISQKTIIDFFPSPQMRESFLQRVDENSPYVHSYPEQNHFNHFLNYDFGCGEIRPVYIAHLDTLLPAWQKQLRQKQLLLEEKFNIDALRMEARGISYHDITARKIIFCDGSSSAQWPFFNLLPFAPNKGEMLLVDIPDLPPHNIYKKGMMVVPLTTPGLFWVGSNYAWEFDHMDPTKEFRLRTEQLLREWLKIPFTVIEHLAGIRPATLERRPFIGIHPTKPAIGILNGMGTKGCSLAPFFAHQFVGHLLHGKTLNPEADVNRFRKILSRNIS